MKLLVSLIVVLTIACSPNRALTLNSQWEFRPVQSLAMMKVLESVSKESELIDLLINTYMHSPYESDYPELLIDRVLFDDTYETKTLIFDIRYVEDMQVVFLVDKQNRIIDNYLISSFE